MTNLDLILNMLVEITDTDISKEKPKNFLRIVKLLNKAG